MKRNTVRIFWVFLGYLAIVRGFINGVEEMYYWKEVIFENLPYDDDYQIGKYPYHIPANNDILALAYHPESDLMIATIGRVRPGVPSALNAFCVSDYAKGSSPHIWGFPNYEQNTLKASFFGETRNNRGLLRKKNKYSAGYYNHFYNNYGIFGGNKYTPSSSPFGDFSIVDIYGPAVDNRCNRLYALDVGIIRYGVNEIYEAQRPAYIVFDLPSNGCQTRKFPVIKRIEIPQHALKIPLGYLFVTIDHQVKGSCDDVFLYSTNIFDNSILVYDYKRDEFWSFTHPSMNAIISESSFIFSSDPWYMEISISSLTLGWPDKYGDRNVYYAPGSSTGEYIVSTKTLKNSKKAPNNYQPGDFSIISYRGCNSQALRQVFDESTGVIFFGGIQSQRISCWNSQLPLNPDTIGVIFESDAVQFVSDMFIDPFGYLWFLSDHLPIIFNFDTPLDITDINSRAFRVKISQAIKGTICDPTIVTVGY